MFSIFCWGLHFACLTCNHIWTVQPSLKSCSINIYPLAKLWELFVRSFCDPFCESVGLMLSKINLQVISYCSRLSCTADNKQCKMIWNSVKYYVSKIVTVFHINLIAYVLYCSFSFQYSSSFCQFFFRDYL
jgi:hypothetical protein